MAECSTNDERRHTRRHASPGPPPSTTGHCCSNQEPQQAYRPDNSFHGEIRDVDDGQQRVRQDGDGINAPGCDDEQDGERVREGGSKGRGLRPGILGCSHARDNDDVMLRDGGGDAAGKKSRSSGALLEVPSPNFWSTVEDQVRMKITSYSCTEVQFTTLNTAGTVYDSVQIDVSQPLLLFLFKQLT